MMRSLYSAVTGLKAQQTAMDVIGNNISNVNTVGFKASRTTFNELFYQKTQSASGPDANTGKGGQNAKQIGLGASVSGINVDITNPGGFETTNRPFDIAINGDSFFIVQNNGSNYFTKAGNFTTDGAGNLVTDGGAYVMGYITDAPGANLQTDMVRPLQIYTAKYMYTDPKATASATLTGNLNKSDVNFGDGLYVTANVSLFDNLGNEYDVQLRLSKTYDADGNAITDDNKNPVYNIVAAGVYSGSKLVSELSVSMTGTLTFDAVTGKILEDSTSVFDMTITGPGSDAMAFTYTQEDVDEYYKENPDGTEPPVVGEPRVIKLDCSKLTQHGAETNIEPAKGIYDKSVGGMVGTGKKVGEMTSVGVQPDGCIVAAYSNGDNCVIGQIAVATFVNPAGLEKMGDNMYAATLNSGEFDGIGKTITAAGGKMAPGVLEMSNVDLAQEFTKMIVTQRGFQSNSRVVTTSDSMIEELLSLKR
ncbi:MAG: flagellar hook protein FlgE [Lachnospiraceae bacterium]|nr:flagellar hook protein FlgE [Lachnospiraceae bacterium]MDE6253711.1 flagellar hook protein FlgE [Lachnospiraceae bacterium]